MHFTRPLRVYNGHKLPTNYIVQSRMTHRIRIPVVSQRSRLQLQTSLNILRDDEITSALPHAAWTSLGCLSITVGELCLPSPKEIAAASNLLQSLGNTFTEKDKDLEPLFVTLRGLHSGGKYHEEQRAHTNRLYWSVTGSAALNRLTSNVRAAFRRCDLLVRQFGQTMQDFDNSLERPPTLKIMNTRSLTSDEPNNKPTLASYKLTRVPVFDSTELYAKYGDTVWAENIPLEKLCISTLGMKDLVKEGSIIDHGYEDVCTVLLPGAPRCALDVDADIEYIRAAESYLENRIVTPLVIPSNSQPLEGRQDFEPGDRKARLAKLNSIRAQSSISNYRPAPDGGQS